MAMYTQRYRGFTMLEIVVVLGIIALLLTVGIANIKRGNESQTLNSVVEQLISDLEEVKQNALAGEYGSLQTEPRGHGIKIDVGTGSYKLFIDDPSKASKFKWDSGEETIIRTLPQGMTISVAGAGNIAFELYTGKLYLNNSPALGEAVITVTGSNGAERTITITPLGVIK